VAGGSPNSDRLKEAQDLKIPVVDEKKFFEVEGLQDIWRKHEQAEKLRKHIRFTYFSLRFGLGLLAFFFPIFLVGIGLIWENISPPGELSAYYFVPYEPSNNLRLFPARGLFVGMLWALGCFLILYQGFSRTENWVLNFAGFCALAVAIFPMYPPEDCRICGTDAWSFLHKPAAIGLFVSMALVAWACSGDTLGELKKKNEQQQQHEPKTEQSVRERVVRWLHKVIWLQDVKTLRRLYYWIAAFMFATPVLVTIITRLFGIPGWWILGVEWAGIAAFSFYWLLKGYELYRSDADMEVMKGEMEKAPPRTFPERMRERAPFLD
jgi:hypothetical protein